MLHMVWTHPMKARFRREYNAHQVGGDVVLETARRWLRLAAYFGEGPRLAHGVLAHERIRAVRMELPHRDYPPLPHDVRAHPRPS